MVEPGEVHLGADSYFRTAEPGPGPFNTLFHQFPACSGTPETGRRDHTADTGLLVGNTRWYDTGICHQRFVVPASQVPGLLVFVISILVYTVLFHHKNLVS